MLPGGRRCRMDPSWQQTKLRLDSIRHEYRVICQELKRTNESQRAIRLCAWASACIDDYLATMRQCRAANQRETGVSP
jgi:hypothetical protein